MTEKQFIIKPQDDYFGITDTLAEDKVNVVNGIRTEIEAKWLCDLLNHLNELAEGNEDQLLRVMSYLHSNYYEIWEEVNKECYND